jgi:hypothetical protein
MIVTPVKCMAFVLYFCNMLVSARKYFSKLINLLARVKAYYFLNFLTIFPLNKLEDEKKFQQEKWAMKFGVNIYVDKKNEALNRIKLEYQ